MENRNDNVHYHGLDLLRGFSGYGVAVAHFFAFSYGSVISEYLSFIFVEFFFVLSGFVLFPQLLRIYNDKKNLLIFYKRRWLRTLPIYIFSLIIASIIYDETTIFDFLKYLFLIQNMFPNFLNDNFFPIAWSLSVEELFYLIFPLIILFFKKENLLKGLLFIISIIILSKILFVNFFDSNFIRIGTFFRFDAILLGFLIRYFYHKLNFSISFFITGILFLIYFNFQNFIIDNKNTFFIKFSFTILMQLISVFVLILFTNMESFLNNKYLKKFSGLVSKQTYSVYLFHLIYIYILMNFNIWIYYKFTIYLVLLIITSTLSFYLLEKPILDRRPKLI
jgi:peptidoglycan/LPS O-acetylase OafA/YrhL